MSLCATHMGYGKVGKKFGERGSFKKAGSFGAGGHGAKTAGYGARSGGYGSKPAGFAPRGRAAFGDKPMAHDATCDVCHKECRVPFKPNGSKPVLCTNCFRRDKGGEDTYSGKRSFASTVAAPRVPGAFGRKPSYGASAPTSSYGESNKLETRLATIESKLDMILKKLGHDGAKAALGEDEFSL